jgi:exoribonuclease R
VTRRRLSLRTSRDARGADGQLLRAGFARIRTELQLPETFPAPFLADAARAVDGERPGAGHEAASARVDLTELAFFTIDPPGSMDLDQAMHLERRGGGFRVRYAIADVASFVAPGGVLDSETHRRGQTLYSPDERTPLHPPLISEGAASLLPGQTRPAVVWTLDLDSSGETQAVDVRRGKVCSRDRLDYTGAQRSIDAGSDERLNLLAEVGRLRKQLEIDRGGVSLPVPEQEIEPDGRGGFRLGYRAPLPVESWNEQISLMTGMAAASIMLHGEIGLLRTLPAAPAEEIRQLRRSAAALGVAWPADTPYAEMIRGLDPHEPNQAALAEQSTVLLRGAGYTAFDGGLPEHATHAAVAAEYAHATAPLRRLADRYVSEVCLCLVAGVEVPDWVRQGLPGLPARMSESDQRAGNLERECLALMEAVVLRASVGQVFDAVVVEVSQRGGGIVQLREPAVRARCSGDLPLGERVRVRLAEADVDRRTVGFVPG